MQEEKDHLAKEYDIAKICHTRYCYVVKQFLLPYAKRKSLQFDDRTCENIDFVLKPLLQDASQAGTLRVQVQVLQQELLAKEKKLITMSDEQFAQEFHKLAALIKTMSRLICPYEGVNVCETLGPGILTSRVGCDHWSGRVGRKLFIEAWTWSILIWGVFRNPFAIFGMESEGIFFLWSSMFNTQDHRKWPQPSLPCENWRRTTMEQMVAIIDKDIFTRSKTKDSYLYLEQQVKYCRASVSGAIESGVALIGPMAQPLQVRQIVDQAFTLAMHMSLQQPRLQLTFPMVGDRFSETEMKSLLGLDEEAGVGDKFVAAVVNPGLTKWGDVHGRNLDHRFDVVPALVQLQTPFLRREASSSLT
jgi:hypothetical protein